jgi:hypothetical protein
MTWSVTAARSLIARCTQLRDEGRTEAVLRAEFQSWLRQVFPDPSDEGWVNHYSEGSEAHTRVGVASGGTAHRFVDNLIRSTVIEYEADLRQARLPASETPTEGLALGELGYEGCCAELRSSKFLERLCAEVFGTTPGGRDGA